MCLWDSSEWNQRCQSVCQNGPAARVRETDIHTHTNIQYVFHDHRLRVSQSESPGRRKECFPPHSHCHVRHKSFSSISLLLTDGLCVCVPKIQVGIIISVLRRYTQTLFCAFFSSPLPVFFFYFYSLIALGPIPVVFHSREMREKMITGSARLRVSLFFLAITHQKH
jgi:uncharacterized membrane protein